MCSVLARGAARLTLVDTKRDWEMTRSFAAPDRRGTFECILENEVLDWQRWHMGDHTISDRP